MKKVVITRQNSDGSIKIIKKTNTIKEAETFLNKDPSIDKNLLIAGNYGIDAPESMLNPKH